MAYRALCRVSARSARRVGYFKMLNGAWRHQRAQGQSDLTRRQLRAPNLVEQTRRLVEKRRGRAIFLSIGTAPQTPRSPNIAEQEHPAIVRSASGASKFAIFVQYPQATLGVQAPFRYRGAASYARHALAKNPNAKFAVISPDDDFGRDYLLGLKT